MAYTWFDPKFRNQVETNVPLSNLLLDKVLGDKVAPSVEEPFAKLELIAPALNTIPINLAASSSSLENETFKNIDHVEEESVESPGRLEMEKETKKEEPATDLVAESLMTMDEIEQSLAAQEEVERDDNAALEVAIHRLLSNSESLANEAVQAQAQVAKYTQEHTTLLKRAMDDTSEILKKDDQWNAVAAAFKEKESAVFQSTELVEESQKSIDKLREILAESKKIDATKKNPAIRTATIKIAELTNAMGSAQAQVRQAEAESRVMLKYKDLVDRGKKQFREELESLMPDVKLGATSKKLTEDELNALIAHAHRRIEQLQKQLAEQNALERVRLAVALEAQRGEDNTIALAAVADERSRSQMEFESDKHRLELDFLVRQEGEVRKQLVRQASAHSDHIKDVLSVQREQLGLDFSRNLNAKILEERENFQAEVASWISRLKGIEAAIDARATSEGLARCAQDLWLACIALNSMIHFGNESEGSAAVVHIRKEVEAVINVGRKHPFVETVANGIPAEAVERGVFTEEQLRTRFIKMSRVCRRLGLITESNASLGHYLVSFLQSFVVFDNVSALTPADQVDIRSLDNYGIVAHAQHFMEKGDLETSLRFMCQLTGESSRAAGDWIKETKLLLETKQAAQSLTAYASATGLANTF